ncbi:MAG: acyl carrier protein [Planctomycetes bacterium]|nr:acyl carrier protein [Planctomycetota bacterium]
MSSSQPSGVDKETVARVEDEIRRFLRENFLFEDGEGSLTNTDSFLEKGIIDSTGILEVVTFVEEKYGIHVEDDELIPENLDSIEKLAGFIARKRDGS